jgi:enoyl-CoA hydratase
MTERVHYRTDGAVARILLDDGKVNVMSVALLADLEAALDRAEQEAAVLVLRSARPGIFSAGFDLRVFASKDPEHSVQMMRAGAELALRLLTYPLPTVAVVEGSAFPMGAFLLLACDLRLGSRGTHRIGLNEVAIGIVPPQFALVLARSRLHPAWLNRTVCLGQMFLPDEAREAGFLDLVVAPDSLDETLERELAALLERVHGPSHATTKRKLRLATAHAMRRAIDRELTADMLRSSFQSQAP